MTVRFARPCVFIRLLTDENKQQLLKEAIDCVSKVGAVGNHTYIADPESFRQVPGSPLCYWISDHIRMLYGDLPPFDLEESGRATRCGLGTLDDFRFIRLRWEVSPLTIGSEWRVYYHGGVYSPYHDQFPCVVRWANSGESIKKYVEEKVGSASRKVQGEGFYFKAGFVFPRRTKGFSPKFMPQGGIFSTAGQAGFVDSADLDWTIGLLSSRICTFLLSLSQGRTGDAAQFEVGLVKRLPWPNPNEATRRELGSLARIGYKNTFALERVSETSHGFVLPALLCCDGNSLLERAKQWNEKAVQRRDAIASCRQRIDEIGLELYGVRAEDHDIVMGIKRLEESDDDNSVQESQDQSEEESRDDSNEAGAASLVASVYSYFVGCVFGVWDIRMALRETLDDDIRDPISPLPTLAPANLKDSPLTPATASPEEYPLRIDWGGILVDDPDHNDDIVRRVREVSEVIWTKHSESIEEEACEIFGVKEIRDYFSKSNKGGFWDDHISRYSKSRRNAPIYWLLQSAKKRYGIWLYYHRLDKDLIFKAIVNYVEPKIRMEVNRLDSFRSQKTAAGDSGKAAKKIDKDIEKQEDFISELKDFEDKLRRAADLHLEPDLNDGVVLNIAPLHELVPWKEAKIYWNELIAGEYEWSSIGKQLREKGLVK